MIKIKYVHISLFLILIALAACGPVAETGEPAFPATPENALEAVPQPAPLEMEATTPPEPTRQLDAPESYPAPPTAVPLPEGYPAPQAIPTIDPYPEAVDGFIWMLLPAGIQCEEDVETYADLKEAVAGLTAVNIQIGEYETTELMVCTACGCPTSAHYRVQVSVADVNAAQALGWAREE